MESPVIYCTSCGEANGLGASYCFKCGRPLKSEVGPAPAGASADFITLSCPSCGGKLEVTPDMERFGCKYCGSEHIVQRSGGVTSLAPVVEGLKRVETKFDQVLTGSDRLAAEQTIQRLKAEIPELERQVAEKETVLKAIIPRESLYHVGRVLINLGSPGIVLALCIPMIQIIFKEELQNTRIQSFIGRPEFFYACVIFFVVCVLLVIVGSMLHRASFLKRKIRPNPKRPSEYEKKVERAQAELAQAQEELQKRKQQLEQLRQYTAER